MTNTLTLSGACVIKAGANVSTAFTGTSAETNWSTLINQAEAFICTSTLRDWITLYSTLSSVIRLILEDAASSHAAMSAIAYDMSGYTSRAEAQTMLNVNYARLTDAIRLLKEFNKGGDFVKNAG